LIETTNKIENFSYATGRPCVMKALPPIQCSHRMFLDNDHVTNSKYYTILTIQIIFLCLQPLCAVVETVGKNRRNI